MTSFLQAGFRASLHLFPSSFHDGYASEMEEIFAERIAARSPLAACGVTVAEIADVVFAAARLRVARATHARPAMIGVVGTIILASAFTVHTLGGDSRRTLAAPLDSVDFTAQDPAGEFTITVRHGQPVAATIDRVPLRRDRLIHSGDSIRFLGPSGRVVLAVAYYRERARIEWQARPSGCRGRAVNCTLYQ
jgi:hypothetical protein